MLCKLNDLNIIVFYKISDCPGSRVGQFCTFFTNFYKVQCRQLFLNLTHVIHKTFNFVRPANPDSVRPANPDSVRPANPDSIFMLYSRSMLQICGYFQSLCLVQLGMRGPVFFQALHRGGTHTVLLDTSCTIVQKWEFTESRNQLLGFIRHPWLDYRKHITDQI